MYNAQGKLTDSRRSAMVAAIFVLVIVLINLVRMQRIIFEGERWEVS